MASRKIERICIHWPRFGPYHLARLETTHRFLAEQGITLIGLETAGLDKAYAWRQERAPTSFQRETVFPDHTFEQIPPREMEDGVSAALDRLQPDAVSINSYSFPDARAALAWCRRNGRIAILVTDSKANDAPRIAWREWVKRHIVQLYDAAFVGGTPQLRYIHELGMPKERIVTGCDVVDNEYFRKGADHARHNPDLYRHLPGLETDDPFFLSSNRFIQRKNLDSLVRAYQMYRERTPNPWRLVLLGDGAERPMIEELIREEGIEGVTLAGFRQIEELPAYYGRAKVFVHPAFVETWGLVINEAMAAGLPILVSENVGCAKDLVIPGENGFRFDPHGTPHLADLMTQISADDIDLEQMSRRSQEIIAAWGLDRFARGTWEAARLGANSAETHGFPIVGRFILGVLRRIVQSPKSFHAIHE